MALGGGQRPALCARSIGAPPFRRRPGCLRRSGAPVSNAGAYRAAVCRGLGRRVNCAPLFAAERNLLQGGVAGRTCGEGATPTGVSFGTTARLAALSGAPTSAEGQEARSERSESRSRGGSANEERDAGGSVHTTSAIPAPDAVGQPKGDAGGEELMADAMETGGPDLAP